MKNLLVLPFLSLAALAADPLPGHSAHGETFNEGPRQAAVLIPGCGDAVKFPISTKNPDAQKFFTQGIGQLHGFWYYESERSFRQAAALDPECPMAYWGMAMANVNNEKRAKGFLDKAVKLKDKASAREKQWITVLENLYKDDKRDKKLRQLDCIRDFETLVQDDPKDIEAKAFLVWRIWFGKGDVPISSAQVVDAMLDQIFAAVPNHPAHHYRIHLWDDRKPVRAVTSAAQCGQASPGIAHMWHMPGHTFSKLKRFDDAVWQQEASTRVDHAYMIRTYILPDQIHNYAHNEEWLTRTFNDLGRAKDAAALRARLDDVDTARDPRARRAAAARRLCRRLARRAQVRREACVWRAQRTEDRRAHHEYARYRRHGREAQSVGLRHLEEGGCAPPDEVAEPLGRRLPGLALGMQRHEHQIPR